MLSEPTGSSFWRGGAFVSLPIQAQFPSAASISCQGQKGLRRSSERGRDITKRKKQVGGREMEEKKYKKEVRDFAVPPHQTLQHSSSPSPLPFSRSLLANKHALLRTHGLHSKLLSLTSAVRHLAHTLTLTPALEHTRALGERCCRSTHSHMPCIPQCLSWLYIAHSAFWVTDLFVL